MVDQIFALLSAQPLVSIVLGFLLAGFLAYILRDELRLWVKKRYNLYTEQEVMIAFDKVEKEEQFYTKVSDNLTPTVKERLLRQLQTLNTNQTDEPKG